MHNPDVNLDAKATAFLEKNHSAAMTTLRRDGSPHTVRIGLAFVDGKLWSSGTADRVRTKHLRRDPRCSLFVFDPALRLSRHGHDGDDPRRPGCHR